MRNTLYIFVLFFLTHFYCFATPVWQRKVVNHEYSSYKAGFQNWMVAQAENGWMYFANSKGLLEYDGVNWMQYPIPNNVMRSLKIIDNRIFIGGSSVFGFFEKDDAGLLSFRSLSESTRDWGGEVWNILDGGEVIYFLAERHLHIYDKNGKGLITIDALMKIDCSAFFKGRLYLGTSDGIFYLDDKNNIVFLTSSQLLKRSKLVSILPYGDKLLVTTARDGLYILDENHLEKMHSVADEFIRNNQLFCTAVSDLKIALGSVQSGIFIFDPMESFYSETYNLNKGLINNTVLSSFFDKDKNLWLGLDKGISYINLNSPIRPLFSTVSPIGTGYCSMVYNDELYLGTNQALYKVSRQGEYQLVKGSEGQIWSVSIVDGALLSAGDNGIMVITPSETYKVDVPGAWSLQPLRADADKLIVGTYSGLAMLKKINGRWIFSHKAPDFIDSSRGFIEDEENYTFWIGNTNSHIQKVTFDPEFSRLINRKIYTLKNTTLEANNIFRIIDNNLVVCALDGLYRYSRISDTFDRYTQLESMLEGPKYYEFLYEDRFKNLWFVSDRQFKVLPYKGDYKGCIYNWGLSDELIDSYENVHMIDSTKAIVSVDNGFARLDLSQKDNLSRNIDAFIRKLTNSRNDSIISYGNTAEPIVLPYKLNSVRIHFAATDYTQLSSILYSYRLSGLDKEWSIPAPITSKEYTNLSEGKYTFEVRTVVNGNICPNVAYLTFTVQPPWFRSPWAYAFYMFLVVVLLYLLYKKTISKQKKIIYQKGEELIAQTKRYEAETKQKDEEIYELQHEKLENELRYKTQEINGYILNIIRKNEMLEDVRKNAFSISKAIDEEKQIPVIKQKVMRLISQINSNIEHDGDFQVFQSNFDLIHKDFFKVLDEKFPELTRNDKILCAYLNMNLSSKEIAPLLNISVRGVEVNRYRLRKKMNLDRDVSLTEFLRTLK